MRCAVAGAGGAIGGHLVARLLADGHEVRASDIKPPGDWWQHHGDALNLGWVDCSHPAGAAYAVEGCEWVFDMAEQMGGVFYLHTERVACAESVEIGINLLRESARASAERFWHCGSACAYNIGLQTDPDNPGLKESDAWPALPEPAYGMSKLYMEELCRFYREAGRIETWVGRYHNIYATHSTWEGGREKAPSAICRKVATAKLSGDHRIEIWGDGQQTRSFCWIDDCIEGTMRLMASDHADPLNIGSAEMVTIDDLVTVAEKVAGVGIGRLRRVYVKDAPQGVRGRSSDNALCRKVLGWEPTTLLEDGMAMLYRWVEAQTENLLKS